MHQGTGRGARSRKTEKVGEGFASHSLHHHEMVEYYIVFSTS